MLRSIPLVAVVAFALVATGCKKSHEGVAKDMVAKLQEMVNVLKTVKDKDSASAAAPKLKAISADMKELKKQADALGKPSEADEKKMKADLQKPMMEAMGDMMKEMMRIQMAGITSPDFEAAMKEVSSSTN
jgi:biopolymer transport protein ExbB/TolQ